MKIIYFLLFFVLINKANAQIFELGKISLSELEEKSHPKDTSAVAAILFKKAKSTFLYTEKNGFSVKHEYIFRIKIYKKDGLNQANYQVRYHVGDKNIKEDELEFSEGVTYNIVNGKIEKTKLNDQGSFDQQISENQKAKTITLPNVKVGSVIEFKYTLKSENLFSFPTFNFQSKIPTNYTEYITEIPIYFIYKKVLKGFIDIDTEENIKNVSKSFKNFQNSNELISYKEITTIHSAKDIPAILDESYIDNLENYISAIDHELEILKLPEKPNKDYSKTWEGVTKTIFENDNFGRELNYKNYFETNLETILKNTSGQAEKIYAIFNFVKNKMNWNNKYGFYTSKGVRNAFKENTGNVAEINFILIAMLNAAGINTNPVLISTLKNGIPSFPGQNAFDYVIAACELDGKQILMDATNKNAFPNILPTRVLNWSGRWIDKNGNSKEIDLIPEKKSKTIVNCFSKINKDGTITGKTRIQKTDYQAFLFRENYLKVSNEDYIEKLENSFNKIIINKYEIQNKEAIEQAITEDFEFETNNHSEIIGNSIYVNPLLFFTQTINTFTQEKRKLPIYFGYPKQLIYSFTFEIPDGYVVKSIPKPLLLSTGENVASFKYNFKSLPNNIQFIFTFESNKMIVSSEFYSILKEFFQKMIDKEKETLILEKL